MGDNLWDTFTENKAEKSPLPGLKTIPLKRWLIRGLDFVYSEHIALQLKLKINNQREVTTADGRKQMVPYVGPN